MRRIFTLRSQLVLFILIALLNTNPLYSQTQKTICGGESVTLSLPELRGNIQWQRSTNLSTWTDMIDATVREYVFYPTTTFYYRAKVTEGSCNPLYSDTFRVIVNPAVVADAGRDTFLCQGSVIALGGSPTAKGGMGPYTYLWSPSTGLNDPTRAIPTTSVTVSTTYTVAVTDKNGCTATDTVYLMVVPVPTADAGSDKTVCSGATVEIGATPSGTGGTPPYTYQWTPSTHLDDNTKPNPTANPVSQTNTFAVYRLTLKDVYGCSSIDEMRLSINSLPIVNAGIDTGYCLGGSMRIGGNPSASGGRSPYTYQWLPSTGLSSSTEANPIASPGSSTTYVLHVTDNNGCTGTDSMHLDVADVLESLAGLDKVICRDGSVVIGDNPAAIGGAPPYSYSWTPNFRINNRIIPNPTVTPNASMYYYLAVTDRYKCYALDSVLVTVGTGIPDAGRDTVLCYGFSTIIGGNPAAVSGYGPFTYKWTPSAGLDNDTLANPTATPTATGYYKLELTDVHGCKSYDSMRIQVNPQIFADAGGNRVTCTSIQIGGLPTASGGTPPHSYSWTPTTGLSNPTLANPIASPNSTTTYTVRVTDWFGCSVVDSMVLTVSAKPVADAGTDKGWCNTAVSLGGSPTASGGAGGYQYKWTPSTGLSFDNVANPTTSIKQPMTYYITVTDANNCTGTDSMRMIGGLVVDAGRDTMVTSGTLTIGGSPSASGGVSPYTYSWSPSTNLSSTTVANPVFSAGINQTYTLTVTDSNGCINTDSVTIRTCTPSTGTQTFSYTGSSQMFVVPHGSCVTQLTVTCNGAGGATTNGGKGGRIVGTVNVKAGDTFIVIVGQAGQTGGTRAGHGGGGFSGLLHSWAGYHIISAGGGGGGASISGTPGAGGDGGGSSGGAAGGTGSCGVGGAGGSADTIAAGGAGGTSSNNATAGSSSGGGRGSDGTYSAGGNDFAGAGGGGGFGTSSGAGGSNPSASGYNGGAGGYGGGGGGGGGGWGSSNNRMSGGGGGGGGFRGGGGGSVTTTSGCSTAGGGGGGGGSNYGKPGKVTVTTNSQGGGAAAQSNGSVTISW